MCVCVCVCLCVCVCVCVCVCACATESMCEVVTTHSNLPLYILKVECGVEGWNLVAELCVVVKR